jgi:hypothetical protein
MRLHGKVHPRVRLLVKHCGATNKEARIPRNPGSAVVLTAADRPVARVRPNLSCRKASACIAGISPAKAALQQPAHTVTMGHVSPP